MTTPKKNFLLEFTDVTEAETNGIIKHVRDPHDKEQANSNNNFHCMVLALFYCKKKDNSFSQNMRVSIFQMFLYLLFIHQHQYLIFFSIFKAYVQLNDKLTFHGIVLKFNFVFSRKISQILPVFKYNSSVSTQSHDILANYVAS
jgi:hypothetical protein